MAGKRDYYEVLGIGRDADARTIKSAYRKLAKKYHPDSNTGNPQAEKTFKEISEAYAVLSDPEKKKQYDQFGHAAFGEEASDFGAWKDFRQSGGNPFGYGGYQEFHFESGDMDSMFGDLFGHMFGRGRNEGFDGSQSHRFSGFREKGEDLTSEVFVTFDEAVFGCEKTITFTDPGKKDKGIQTLKVKIPAGIETGKTIRLAGKGMPGKGGGAAGDLLLKVTVGDKAGFERKGMDIYSAVSIPFSTAVLGGEALVHTLYGDVMCRIQPGTQSGTKIRLRGKGVVSMRDSSVYGDQYAEVRIAVPKGLGPEAKRKLEEFEAALKKEGKYHAA